MKKTPLFIRVLLGWAVAASAFTGLSCNTGDNGGPVEDEQAPATLQKAEPTASAAYHALRQEIMGGNLVALYDICSERSQKEKFAPQTFRTSVASNPGLQSLKLTAAHVAKMDQRTLVETYFRLLSEENRKDLALAMASVKVLGTEALPDGRQAIDIESDGVRSRLLWVLENGAWKMDGEVQGAEQGK